MICSACHLVHHASCVSAERRCACGAPLFVPALRATTNEPVVHFGAVLRAFARRELWRWLLPVPFWVLSAWVLSTSERVWTETILVSGGRGGGPVLWTVGALGRVRLITALLFFAIAPALAAWFLRLRRGDTDSTHDGPPPASHRAIEWAVRIGALLWIAWVTHFVWSYR